MLTRVKYQPILDTVRASNLLFRVKHGDKQPLFFLIHPNDYEKLLETSPANADRIYSVPIITSPLVNEHEPIFVL